MLCLEIHKILLILCVFWRFLVFGKLRIIPFFLQGSLPLEAFPFSLRE